MTSSKKKKKKKRNHLWNKSPKRCNKCWLTIHVFEVPKSWICFRCLVFCQKTLCLLSLLRYSVYPRNRTANREPNRKGISFYRTGKEPNRMDISFYETEPNRTDYKNAQNRTEPLLRLLAQVGLVSQGFTWFETLTGRSLKMISAVAKACLQVVLQRQC